MAFSLIFVLSAAFVISNIASANGSWTSKAPMSTARIDPSVGAINGKLYVASGCCTQFVPPFGRIPGFEAYDPTANSWAAKSPIPLPVYTIQGNFSGTNASGSAALPNGGDGIRFAGGATDNLLGGTVPGARNLVSGNLGHGVHIDDLPVEEGGPHLGTARITVQVNFIGTDLSGINPIGNRLPGVIIFGGASDNLIGGTAPGAGNVVAFTIGGTFDDGEGNFITDPGAGISIANDNNVTGDGGGGNSARNRISQNKIFGNNGLGIDLNLVGNAMDSSDGPTANDSCDPDSGPNNFQNRPQLTSVCHTGNTATIQGTLNGEPGTTFTVEFFANAACDSSGSGEGQTYLGSIQVTTDATCTASFSFSGTTPGGQPFITATATDPVGNTSEFSNCLTDVDTDNDGTSDCLDSCPADPNKTNPGACGCGVADIDTDGDGTANCLDSCPNDPNKTAPGVCGCGVADTDSDGDGVKNCIDNCPTTPNPGQGDWDNDGIGDACYPPSTKEQCKNGGWQNFTFPRNPNKIPGGIAFDFLSKPDTALLGTSHPSYNGNLLRNMTGKALSARVGITVTSGTPVFTYYGEPDGCGRAANVRFYLRTDTGGKFEETDYWWSNPMSVDLQALTVGDQTLVPNFSNPAEWSDFYGHFGNDPLYAAAFAEAIGDVQFVGLSFGGGYFFENGVGIQPGTGSASFDGLYSHTEIRVITTAKE